MTQRERQASGGVSAAAPRPPLPAAAPPRPAAATAPAWGPIWEDFYRSATPAQQSALMTLACRQGVLYAHQLPPVPSPADRGRQFLTRLLNGQTEDLAPVRPAPVEVEDAELDAGQREAVARALGTPDLCLLQGLPGTGKSRVVAEVVTRACARGERVLLLAPHAAAVDRVLRTVGGREAVFAVRCLARDERPESLPEAVRALTFAERVRWLGEHTLEHARREVVAAEQRCDRRRQERELWDRLEELAERSEELAARGEELRRRLAAVPEEVRREAAAQADGTGPATPFLAALADLARAHRETVARLDAEAADLERAAGEKRREQAVIAARLEELRPLSEARELGRWWTLTYWKAAARKDLLPTVEAQRKRLAEIGAALEKLGQDRERLAARREEAARDFEAEQSRRIAEETARRQGELSDQAAAVGQERRQLEEKWQAAVHGLAPAAAPAALTRDAVAAARQEWRPHAEEDEERQAFARQWAACLEQTAEDLPNRVRGLVNLVAGTTAALAADPQFGDAAARDLHFDLLVLEGADQVTESEFLAAARRARRWVLVGEPPPEGDTDSAGRGPRNAERKPRGPRPTPAALRPGFFHRLWQHLHCDPRRLPYRWAQEGDRLVCQLRPVRGNERQWLEAESVADSPDVELRILSLPRARPVLAEVVFPRGTSVGQAKEYIFRELQELPVRAEGHSLRWEEEADRLVLRLGDCRAPHALEVRLGEGVREMMAGRPAANGNGPCPPALHTCCIEFHRAAGWQRDRAEEWVRQYLGVCDLGRTARLDVPHRMDPGLARFLSDLLFADGYRVADAPAPAGPHAPVHFVPVPPLAPPHSEKDRRGRPAAPRGGAGLELDLADGRHRDRLPSELRPLLGERGLVNYLEAQAVVRALERLAQDPAPDSPARHAGDGLALGVVALYPAQAELIRRLAGQSPCLAALGPALKVDVPAAFREDECPVVLLSLTRSHTHRAVSFGDGPHHLALALTRARRRLIVFGDPGTLARRGQWEEALDPLDAAASARERTIVTGLVGYLNGQGRHGDAFHLWTGSSA